jgi:hypothetical protein
LREFVRYGPGLGGFYGLGDGRDKASPGKGVSGGSLNGGKGLKAAPGTFENLSAAEDVTAGTDAGEFVALR